MQLIAITKEYLFQDNMLSNIIQIQTQLKQKNMNGFLFLMTLLYLCILFFIAIFLSDRVSEPK